jgi:hypothetical protein
VVGDRDTPSSCDGLDDVIGRIGGRTFTMDVDTQIVDDNPRAAGREKLRVRTPDPATGAGDNGYSIAEVKPGHGATISYR